MKMTSTEKIFLTLTKTALTLSLFIQAASAMEPHPALDKTWTWYGAPKLKTVINAPHLDQANKITNINRKAPRLAVLDEYINPQACKIADTCLIKAPTYYDFYDNDHGSHVANTALTICPTARIHTNLGVGIHYNLVDALKTAALKKNIDVINMSLGCKVGSESLWFKGSSTYKALVSAANAGKIMVKSLGNDHDKVSSKDHKAYCEALMNLAEDPALKGRLILVANSSYLTNDDALHKSSNRPHRESKYAITAPGTMITAKTSKYGEKTYTGTSMSAPIISGTLLQLLCDFGTERQNYSQYGFKTDFDFKDYIKRKMFDCARKKSLKGTKLGNEFGQGIVDFGNTKKAIEYGLKIRDKNRVEIPIKQPEPVYKKPESVFINPNRFNAFVYIHMNGDLVHCTKDMTPDKKKSWALDHYIKWGSKEEFRFHFPLGIFYISKYKDLYELYKNLPIEQKEREGRNHYKLWGSRPIEKRDFSFPTDFNGLAYINAFGDLKSHFSEYKNDEERAAQGLLHYVTYGYYEMNIAGTRQTLYNPKVNLYKK